MTTPSSFASYSSSPLVQSICNNYIPPDTAPDDIASYTPLPDRQALLETLAETDVAIRQIEVHRDLRMSVMVGKAGAGLFQEWNVRA